MNIFDLGDPARPTQVMGWESDIRSPRFGLPLTLVVNLALPADLDLSAFNDVPVLDRTQSDQPQGVEIGRTANARVRDGAVWVDVVLNAALMADLESRT